MNGFPISVARIAQVLPAPEENVGTLWPLVEQCMDSLGVGSTLAKVAALATIHVEDPKFEAGRGERYNGDAHEYFAKYDGRADLGNTQPGDGYRFRGRGPSQLTGRSQYRAMGALLGCDLVGNPDMACEPNCAAAVFAAFFHMKQIQKYADAKDWARVRRRWNGGLNGYDDFLNAVTRLLFELSAHPDSEAVCAAG